MLLRERVEPVTHTVESLSFLQNCRRRHLAGQLSDSLRRGELQDGLT